MVSYLEFDKFDGANNFVQLVHVDLNGHATVELCPGVKASLDE